MSKETKELENKISRLEGRIDELSKQVSILQKDSHPMHLMPCKFKEPNPQTDYPPGYGPLGPVVTC